MDYKSIKWRVSGYYDGAVFVAIELTSEFTYTFYTRLCGICKKPCSPSRDSRVELVSALLANGFTNEEWASTIDGSICHTCYDREIPPDYFEQAMRESPPGTPWA